MRTGVTLTLLTLALGVPACAQNSDLGFLVGITPSRVESSISPGTISSTIDSNVQIDYSVQLRQTPAGAFYLELPLAFVSHESDRIGPGVTSAHGNIIFFTPGIRWKMWVHSRVSFYAALGGGLASFSSSVSTIGPGLTHVSSRSIGGAIDFGGGIDFRLTRLLSLRFEGRDYVSGSRAGGFAGRNHAALDIGLGFHF